MICPLCNSDKGSFVVNSRDTGTVRRRRHTCYNCDKRFSTYEISAIEYEKLQTIRINVNDFDNVIASLRAIKVKFGDDNGTTKDRI